MVDFRYHLVSLIAVFMALAVGIILGAGPLQNSIGNALTDQVDSLRASRDEARADVDAMTARVGRYEEGLTALGSELTASSLEGMNIGLVVLPGADGSIVENHRANLESAGATVSGTITVQDAMVAEDVSAFRSALAGQLDDAVAGTSREPMERLGHALVTILSGQPSDNQTLIELLQSGDNQLIDMTDAVSAPASAVLVIAGPTMERDPEAEPVVDVTLAPTTTLVRSLAELHLVVLGDADERGLVGVLRSDSSDGGISTVDSPEDPTSLINVPLAFTQEAAGGSVSWGLAEGTSKVIGDRAEVLAPEENTTEGGEGEPVEGEPTDGVTSDGEESGQPAETEDPQ